MAQIRYLYGGTEEYHKFTAQDSRLGLDSNREPTECMLEMLLHEATCSIQSSQMDKILINHDDNNFQ